jgi:hypothetical protein
MEHDMSKVIVELGYRSYVLDAKDAVALADMFGKAERYEAKWHNKTKNASYDTVNKDNGDVTLFLTKKPRNQGPYICKLFPVYSGRGRRLCRCRCAE